MCTSAESFISSSTTSLLSLFGAKLWLGLIATLASQSYSLFASILKFLCVCVIYLYTSNLLISTRQRTSSLDRYLTLQQLEFRLHSLCITPHQAPQKNHHNRYSLFLYSPRHHFQLPPHICFPCNLQQRNS